MRNGSSPCFTIALLTRTNRKKMCACASSVSRQGLCMCVYMHQKNIDIAVTGYERLRCWKCLVKTVIFARSVAYLCIRAGLRDYTPLPKVPDSHSII